MFKFIDEVVYDKDCNLNGRKDYIRRVFCLKGGFCEDEDILLNVILNY